MNATAVQETQRKPLSLDDATVSPVFVGRVPIGFARRFGIIGIDGDKGSLTVAMASPKSLAVAANVGVQLGVPVTPILTEGDEIQTVINRAYGDRGGDVNGVVDAIRLNSAGRIGSDGTDGTYARNTTDAAGLLTSLETGTDLLDDAGSAPVIRLVNAILFKAVKRRASDVHVQPYADRVQVRLRVDGVLYDFVAPPKRLHEEMVSRIKVVAGLNIAEKRLPQDGRTTVSLGERVVDLRISTLPTCHGERVVLRLLDKSARLYALDELGMGPAELSVFDRLIRRTHGLFLVTGPTGSGKSTTLYGALQALDATQLNVLTIEDPIEYRLPGISQTQISDKKGLTFASGLRTILRQDPDVIMVGEIRDEATARMAVQSALTGHLVFSTLHTNDAAGAVARLLDLGVEPYLVAGALIGVLAQRLVRRICTQCKRSRPMTTEERAALRLGDDVQTATEGAGCDRCLHTGYYERIGIFELLRIDDDLRGLILDRADSARINRAAIEAGMRTLRQDAVTRMITGLTTVEEVLKVTHEDGGR